MLTIRDLSYLYPNGTRALDHVSLDLPAGMFGLLGPNGAGKSTLMRCIATLQTPQSGIAQALLGNPRLIIVDEPTAGLDPEERNRFLNLLAEIGENVVVILSTHIVEDVAELCPRMAILAGGRIVADGVPSQLIDSLQGRVWRKVIGRDELEPLRAAHQVIATRLLAGRTVVHVLADTTPGDGFAAATAGLEDVYFATLAVSRRAA